MTSIEKDNTKPTKTYKKNKLKTEMNLFTAIHKTFNKWGRNQNFSWVSVSVIEGNDMSIYGINVVCDIMLVDYQSNIS